MKFSHRLDGIQNEELAQGDLHLIYIHFTFIKYCFDFRIWIFLLYLPPIILVSPDEQTDPSQISDHPSDGNSTL